jgi:zinc transport system ATP-binding protein
MTQPARVLDVDDVHFGYDGEPVLRGVSLHVGAGEFVALAGPNGSGKSTLLRVVLGLARPHQGSVRLLGAPPAELGRRQRWRVGYVPQRSVLPENLPATVTEVVSSGRIARSGWARLAGRSDADAVEHALESVGVAGLGRRRMHELSGGQQQRVLIAKALVNEPVLLVLDEPVAGVDAESQRLFRDALVHLQREHGAAVLLVSHEFGAVADDLDRLLVMQAGRVAFDGTPSDFASTGVSLGVHRDDMPVWLEGLGDS